MGRVIIYTYDFDSEGGLELKKAIETQTGKDVSWVKDNDHFTIGTKGTIICWGNVHRPLVKVPFSTRILNGWHGRQIKAHKLKAFIAMRDAGVPTVSYTPHEQQAQQWLHEGSTIICRLKVGSQDSAGIEVVVPKKTFFGRTITKTLPSCKLYTRYVPQAREFRVHCTPLYFIDGLEKKKLPTGDPHIFHQDHGLFCRDGVVIPQTAINAAKAAVKACGLEFGAVDLLWSNNDPYVLEVNTAPGLLPSEAKNYAKAFVKHEYI
ncbi:MAG: hypothetical protein MN733_11175 [Nitrososphaera sp.]|nr:hypothetical protein [Nitrososphaera sp.]